MVKASREGLAAEPSPPTIHHRNLGSTMDHDQSNDLGGKSFDLAGNGPQENHGRA